MRRRLVPHITWLLGGLLVVPLAALRGPRTPSVFVAAFRTTPGTPRLEIRRPAGLPAPARTQW